MAVVIRLMRAGAKKRPFFRMVAADSRRQRDGRFLEILGHYNPVSQPFELVVHKDKVERWLSRGAQPSEQVASLLRRLGITMQRAASAAAAAIESAAGLPAAVEPKVARAGKKVAAKAATPRRAVPRKVSARKAERKTARKVAKAAGKPAPTKGAARKAKKT
jgi:small subunit ribosomal protein S16